MVVFGSTIEDGTIVSTDLMADHDQLERLDVENPGR